MSSGDADPISRGDVVASLRTTIRTTCRPLLDAVDSAALLDFPNHNNPGDSAIWLGELALLKECGVRLAYVADHRSYDAGDLRAACPDGPILLHGGGNLGDLWPKYQEFREAVLSEFRDRLVIQMPQTAEFRESESWDRFRSVIDGRRERTVILCRDEKSWSVLQGVMDSALLCPDSALLLEPRLPASDPTHDVLILQRGDQESGRAPLQVRQQLSMLRSDWVDVRELRALTAEPLYERVWQGVQNRSLKVARGLAAVAPKDSGSGRVLRQLSVGPHRRLAATRTERAFRLLSRGRVLVTDRLHGHILGLLLDRPQVLLGDRYGKVQRFHQTFTRQTQGVHWAATEDEAQRYVESMLADFAEQG